MSPYFSQQITWPAWKFGMLKFSMIALGILLGAHFPEFWKTWYLALWLIFGVTAVLASVWGFRSMIEPSRN